MGGPDIDAGIDVTGDFNPQNTFPGDPSVATIVDYQGSVREGAEIVMLPLDPTSRRYIDLTNDGYVPPDPALTLGSVAERAVEAYLEPHLHWPYLWVSVAAAPASTTIGLLELIQDWEIQPYPGSFGSRAARPSPPENQPFIRSLGDVGRSIMDAGLSVASKVSVQMAGGIERFLVNGITSGAGRLLTAGAAAAFSRFAPRAALPGVNVGRFADRFEAIE